MAINFASSLFKPAIICDKVNRDGYSIQNLISSNSSERSKGYMSESFIKPPVTIVIRFCCNVELSHLIINTAVGSQKTHGVEVFTKSDPIEISFESNPPELSSDATSGTFVFMGKAVDLKASIFCFKNKTFKAFESYLQPNFDGLLEGTICRDLRRNSANALNNVSHLMIRLILTQGGNLPAIKTLEVWGQPSLSCPRSTISSVLELFHANCSAYNEETDDEEILVEKSSTIPSTQIEDMLDGIPIDFIDSLTCSLMSMPILLPSGHTIDQLTLDKFIDSEATWGRGPSDPFTGVAFTKNSEPVPNIPLKVRLDQYLLSCGNDPKFNNVARSLGRESDSHSLKSSILVAQDRETKISNKDIQEHNKCSKKKSSCSKSGVIS